MQRALGLSPVLSPKFFSLSIPLAINPLPFPLPQHDLAAFYQSDGGKQFVAGFEALLEALKSWLKKHAPHAQFNEQGYARLKRHLHYQAMLPEKILLNFYQVAIPCLWRLHELLSNDLIPETAKKIGLVEVFNAATACEGGAANEFSDIEISWRAFLSFQNALTQLRLDMAKQVAYEIYNNYDSEVEALGDAMQTHYVRGMLNANASWFGLPHQPDPQACDEGVLNRLAGQLQLALQMQVTPRLIYDRLWFGTANCLYRLQTEFYQAVLGVKTPATLMHCYQQFLARLTMTFGPVEKEGLRLLDLINVNAEDLPDYDGALLLSEQLANVVSWKAGYSLRLDLVARLEFSGIMQSQQTLHDDFPQFKCAIARDDLYSSRVIWSDGSYQPLLTYCVEHMISEGSSHQWERLLDQSISIPYRAELTALLIAYVGSPAYRERASLNPLQYWQAFIAAYETFSQTFKESYYLRTDWPIRSAQQVALHHLDNFIYQAIHLTNGELFLRALSALSANEIQASLEHIVHAKIQCMQRLSFPALNLVAQVLRRDVVNSNSLLALVRFILETFDFEYALAILDGREVSGNTATGNLTVLLENAFLYSNAAWNQLIIIARQASSAVSHHLGNLSSAHHEMLMQHLDPTQQSALQEMVIIAQGIIPTSVLNLKEEARAAWAREHKGAFIEFFLSMTANSVSRLQDWQHWLGGEWVVEFFKAFTGDNLARLVAKKIPKEFLLALVPVSARGALLQDWRKRCPNYFSPNESLKPLLLELNPADRVQLVLSIDANWLKQHQFMECLTLLPPRVWLAVVQRAGNGLPPMQPSAVLALLTPVPSNDVWPIIKCNPANLFVSSAFEGKNEEAALVELFKRFSAEDAIDCVTVLFTQRWQTILSLPLRQVLVEKLSASQWQLLIRRLANNFHRSFLQLFSTVEDKILLLKNLPVEFYSELLAAQGLHPYVGRYSRKHFFVPAEHMITVFKILSGLQPERYQAVLQLLQMQGHQYCFEVLASSKPDQFQSVGIFRTECLAYLLNQQNPPKLNAEEFFALLDTIPWAEQPLFLAALQPCILTGMVLGKKELRAVLEEKDQDCTLSKVLVYCQLYINDCGQDQRAYRNTFGGLFGEPSRETKLASAKALRASLLTNMPGDIGDAPSLNHALSRDTLRLIMLKLLQVKSGNEFAKTNRKSAQG